LDAAIAAAGLARGDLFITNAVKHFKWEPRGKRRLHKKPGAGEISACVIWLDEEIANVRPRVIVALGATALRALTGVAVTVEGSRGRDLRHRAGSRIVATYHPAAIMRALDEKSAELRGHLVDDLSRARELAALIQ
jgi:DNA polymerase